MGPDKERKKRKYQAMISDALDGPSRVARVLKSTGAYVFAKRRRTTCPAIGDYAPLAPKRPEGFRQKAWYYAVCIATSIYNGLAFMLCCLARWLGGKHLARDKDEDEVEEVDPNKPFSLEDLIDKDEWEPPRTDEGSLWMRFRGYNYKIAVAQWFDNVIMFAVVWSVLALDFMPTRPVMEGLLGRTTTRPTPPNIG